MADKIGIQAGAGDSQAYEWTRSNYGVGALSIHERAISMLRAQEQRTPSLYLDVNPGSYRYGSTIVLFAGGISPAFSPPVAGTRLDVLYLDCATGTLAIEEGSAATLITDALELPELPDHAIPLVAVHLAADQTSITEADLYDMRPFLAADKVPWLDGADGEALLSDGTGGAGWAAPGITFVPLATPLTSTAWDGDAYGTANNGIIDLSAVFGVPAGIKAVAVSIAVRASSANVLFALRPTSGVNDAITVRCQIANQYADNAGIVSCDANGDIYARFSATNTGTYLLVTGYWI